MYEYEVMFIVKPMPDEEVVSITDKVTAIINTDGKVLNVDVWGEKRLAFDLEGFEKGIYILVTFHATPNCIKAVDEHMKINEAVLRHMIVRKGC